MDGEAQDPAAWLRAAILERKTVAEAATCAPWEAEGDDPTDDEVWIDVDGQPWRMVILRGPQSHENMLHVAANDPQDTIARCEAELAILVEHAPEWADYVDGDGIGRTNLQCKTCEPPGTPDNYPCRTVRLLLGAYKHRSGYGERWGATIG